MAEIQDPIILITGASSGIGAACARAFATHGAKLILAARRRANLESLAEELSDEHGTACHLLTLDVRDEEAVNAAIAELPERWRAIDVLVNNAGLSRGLDKVHEGTSSDWNEMLDTNVKGLLWVSRAVLPGMVTRGRGHVINLGSLAGHEVYPGGGVYCASKHAVRALGRGMHMDLLGTGVRVSSVDPGMVDTEFSLVRFHGDEARAAKAYEGLQPLVAEDIARAVLFCATQPPHVNVSELVVMPTAQASVVLNHREK